MDIRKTIIEPYNNRKKLLSFSQVRHIRKYMIAGVFLLLLYLLYKKYFLFFIMTGFSSIFSFYHSRYNKTPMDLKLALFLGIIITRHYGIVYTFFFFIVSDIVPALLGGESINGPDLFFFGWYFIVTSLVLLFPAVPMDIIGPILVVVHTFGAVFINNKIGGIPSMMSFMIEFFTTVVRIIYFLTLGRIIEPLLGW
ncbi:MAG: hypothetical protein HGA85_09510 [Nanoarchaeota archaeon]|nr:hypothetical protein [Nanoarchaeota archaeon]